MATRRKLLAGVGLDAAGIEQSITQRFGDAAAAGKTPPAAV